MAFTVERELFSFSENDKEIINSRKPLSCASDNRFSICCRESIFVFTLSCDLDSRSDSFHRNVPVNLFAQRIVDLATFPTFCISEGVIDLCSTLSQISHLERQELLTDACLSTRSVFPSADLGGFLRAVFSPSCSSVHRLFIAAITSDYRVFIFEEHSGEWTLSFEFTQNIKKHVTASVGLPVTIGNDNMSFDEYKKLIYSMCCVELMWSSPFQNNGSPDPLRDTFLLFCGMRNGDLLMWEIKTSPGLKLDENSVSFVTKDEYTSEVTCLSWNSVTSYHGVLAVGYMDGNIRILRVLQISNGDKQFEIEEVFVHNLSDHLSVFDLSFTQMDRSTSILVACKQFYIGIYCLEELRIQHVKTIHMDCSLPLVSVSLYGRFGTIASQDGAIFHLNFGMELGDISVQHSKSKITCLPYASHVSWNCKGLGLSVNGAFFLSIHSPLTEFPVTFYGRSYSERQKIVLTLSPQFSKENYIFPPTCRFPMEYKTSIDTTVRLLLILKYAFSTNQSLEMIEEILEKLDADKRVENMQVAKAVYFFEFVKIQGEDLQNQALKFSSPGKPRELAEMILVEHVSNCLHWAMENPKDIDKLHFMCQWVSSNEKRQEGLSEDVNLDRISSLLPTESKRYRCCICDEEMTTFKDLIDIECVNGHRTQLCSLTLNPVEGLNCRRCLSCQTAAINIDETEYINLPFIIKNKDLCILCGGALQ